MLTLPAVVERPETPYVALRKAVTLPFDDEIPAILDKLFAHLTERGVPPAGPVFFKHNVVAMPDLIMEFGVPVAQPVETDGDFVSGTLPPGRYAEITWYGPYDDLVEVNGVLILWSRGAGMIFDSVTKEDGEHFANRTEIYHNSPAEEPDPAKLATTVSIKLKD
jgi:effector-binding domain-containing protein